MSMRQAAHCEMVPKKTRLVSEENKFSRIGSCGHKWMGVLKSFEQIWGLTELPIAQCIIKYAYKKHFYQHKWDQIKVF